MIPIQRLEEIFKYIEKEETADIYTLSELFRVTGKTIRQDLSKLESLGLVSRVRGGAVLKKTNSGIFPIRERKQKHLAEKERIGVAAAQCIDDDDVVILDGGSTTLPLARQLAGKRVIVLTNDIVIATELLNVEEVTLYVTGGKLRREGAFTLLGRDAEETIRKYNAHKLFLATSAFHLEQGLTVLSEEESELKKAMIRVSRKVICLVDYSKFHKLAFAPFAEIADLDMVITDDRIEPQDSEYLLEKGIKLEVV